MQPNRKLLLKKIILACCSVLFVLVMMEIVGSIYSYIYYPRMTRTDATLGWLYVPTTEGIARQDRKDVSNQVFINKEGFRDQDFSTEEEFLRIMVLGDSMTFGLEADQDEIYPGLVEQQLREKLSNPKIDVMNFGITGFSTTQELLTLRKYAPKYRPQIVVLAITEGNDFEDNTKIFWNRYTPHFELEDGKYVLHDKPSAYYRTLNYLRDHSTVFYFLCHLCKATRPLFIDHVDLNEDQKIDLAIHNLNEIRQFTEDKEIRLYIFYIHRQETPVKRFEAVQAFAQEHGIPIHLIPMLREEQVSGIGHWNAKGHASAAKIVSEILLTDDLVAARTQAAEGGN